MIFSPKHREYKPHKSLFLLTWGQRTLRDGSWSQQKPWWCELLPPNPSFLLLPSTSWSQSHQSRGESKGRTTKPENLTPVSPCARVSSTPNPPPTPLPRIWGGSPSPLYLSAPQSYLPALTRSASGRSPLPMLQEGCSSSARAGTHGCWRLILGCRRGEAAQPRGQGLPKPFPACPRWGSSEDFRVPPPSFSLFSQPSFSH